MTNVKSPSAPTLGPAARNQTMTTTSIATRGRNHVDMVVRNMCAEWYETTTTGGLIDNTDAWTQYCREMSVRCAATIDPDYAIEVVEAFKSIHEVELAGFPVGWMEERLNEAVNRTLDHAGVNGPWILRNEAA